MTDIRKQIENQFENFARLICRRHWLILAIMFILVVGLALQIPRLTIDTSNEAFFHKDDPTLKLYNEFRDQFGRDEMIVIAIQPTNVFDFSFLKKLKALHNDLEENVPHIMEITSLINARNTRGDKGSLIVEDLLENWPEDSAALNDLKNRVMTNPLYQNRLISEDGRLTTIIIETDCYSSLGIEIDALSDFDESQPAEQTEKRPYLTTEENSAAVEATQVVLTKYRADEFKIYLAGSPVVMDTFKRAMIKDMKKFMRLAVLTIGICLFLMFRRISGVLLPLLIVALSLVSTLGLMGILGVQIKMPTTILPSFLLAVGVGGCVHLLAIFFQNLQKTEDQEGAIVHALGHSGLPVAITSLTTMAGLASFTTAEVAPIADLGIYSSIGVILALIYTIVLLPTFLAIFPIRAKKNFQTHQAVLDKILSGIANFSIEHSKAILIMSVFVIFVALIGAARLHFSHNVLSWLPQDSNIRRSTEKIDKELKGTVVVEVILDTGRENGLYDPATLKNLDQLARIFEQMKQGSLFVGKVISVADVLKEIHQALNENRSEFYVIPNDRKLIPQEFLLFENSGSDDLEDVIDSRFRLARFTVKVPWTDALQYIPFLKEVEARFRDTFGTDVQITVTGMMALFGRTFNAAIHSAAESYVFAFVVITLMMILLTGSIRIGFISMIPNLTPIIVTMGIMGWFGFPLNMFTMLIGAIAIGLAVDDTVHFMYNFRRYYYEFGDVRESVHQTFNTAGRAMLVTSIVLSIGFFIFMFASMNNIFFFGFLTGITVLLALLADFIMAPALMSLINQPTINKKEI